MKDLSNRLPEVKVVAVNHNKVRVYGGVSSKIYDGVFQLARDKGIEVKSVNSIKPTLEDAFIKIIGLSPLG